MVSTLLTPVIRRFAIKHNLFDMPDGERKVHVRPIPRLGGLAIIAGFYVPMVGVMIYHNKLSDAITANTVQMIGLFIGGALVLLIGLYDDLKGADAIKKLTIQILIGIISYYLGYRIIHMRVPGMDVVTLWPPLSLVITVLWFVAMMNAMNLVDGLDGLASGVSFFILVTLGVMAVLDGDSILLLFIATISGAVAGFWPHNKSPATIFMGDTGSLFIGFVLAAISIRTASKSSTLVAMFIPLIAMGLPLFDTLLAIIRRLLTHKPIMQADHQHIHHKLLSVGLTPKAAVQLLYLATILLGVFAIFLRIGNQLEVYLSLFALAVVVAAFVRFGGIGELLIHKQGNKSVDLKGLLPIIEQIASNYQQDRDDEIKHNIQKLAKEIGNIELKLIRNGRLAASGGSPGPTTNVITAIYRLNGEDVLEISCKRASFDATVERMSIAAILARELMGKLKT